MYVVKEDTALTIPIFAHDANGDPVTGLLTGDWTKRISTNSGSFADLVATITEMEGGFYQLILTSSHTDTAGLLTIYLTHASCEQVNLQFRVERRLLADLCWPTTSGQSLDVNPDGTCDPNLDNATGTLDKSQTTGFNDPSTASIAAAVWLNSSGSGIVTSLVSIAAGVTTAISAPSLALADYAPLTTTHGDALAASTALAVYTGVSTALSAYDAPTHGEMTAELAALNDITVAEILAATADGSLTVQDALKALIAYVRGRVVKSSTAFAYYSQTSTTLWVSNITSADRNIL